MKLNEITPDLIDEMIEKHPIRGLLNYKKLQSVDTIHKTEVCFHSSKGWFYFFKSDLKESKRFFSDESKNDKVEILQTKKGIIYCFLDNNTLCFFKKKGRQGVLQPWSISMNYSNGVNKTDIHGFLLSKGVECYVRKFIIPHNSKGEMMIGHWHEEYISAKN